MYRLCAILCVGGPLWGTPLLPVEVINIHNNTQKTWFVAPYYVRVHTRDRIATPQQVLPNAHISFARPPFAWDADRYVYVSADASSLKAQITPAESESIAHGAIGGLRGVDYYLEYTHNTLIVSNWFSRLIDPVIHWAKRLYKRETASLLSTVAQKYQSPVQASVRIGTELSRGEREFLRNHQPVVRDALNTKFADFHIQQDESPLVIAYALSGGGVRSMLGGLGILQALQPLQLYDSLTYVSGVSGGTWSFLLWYATELPLNAYIDRVIAGSVTEPTTTGPYIRIPEITELLMRAISLDNYCSLVNIFGALVTQKTIGSIIPGNLNTITLDMQRKNTTAGWPYPIVGTCIDTEPFEWFEFTPDECGSAYLQAWVPTEFFGRRYYQGHSTDQQNSLPLSYYVGTAGSAMSFSLKDLLSINYFSNTSGIGQELSLFGGSSGKVANFREFLSKTHNITYGLSQLPLHGAKTVGLLDGGVNGNMPFALLARPERHVDLIIGIFADQPDVLMPQRQAIDAYMRRHHLSFPVVAQAVQPNNCAVLIDEQDLAAPVVILLYQPKDFEAQHPYSAMFNFEYTKEQSRTLITAYADMIKEHEQEIYTAYKKALERKRLREQKK